MLSHRIAPPLGMSATVALNEQQSYHALFGLRSEGPFMTVQPSGGFTLTGDTRN